MSLLSTVLHLCNYLSYSAFSLYFRGIKLHLCCSFSLFPHHSSTCVVVILLHIISFLSGTHSWSAFNYGVRSLALPGQVSGLPEQDIQVQMYVLHTWAQLVCKWVALYCKRLYSTQDNNVQILAKEDHDLNNWEHPQTVCEASSSTWYYMLNHFIFVWWLIVNIKDCGAKLR